MFLPSTLAGETKDRRLLTIHEHREYDKKNSSLISETCLVASNSFPNLFIHEKPSI